MLQLIGPFYFRAALLQAHGECIPLAALPPFAAFVINKVSESKKKKKERKKEIVCEMYSN